MNKRFRETVVGIFIVIGLVMSVVLYTWLTGRLGLRNSYDVKAYFQDVGGLRVGDPILVFGLEKGRIKALRVENNRVLTVLAMDRDIKIGSDARVELRSVSALGGDKYIKVNPGRDTIPPDTAFIGINATFDLENLAAPLASVGEIANQIKDLDIDGTLEKAASRITGDFQHQLALLTADLMRTTSRLNLLLAHLDSLVVAMQGDGTFGRLAHSPELYEELRATSQALRELLLDINADPKKYINIKVF